MPKSKKDTAGTQTADPKIRGKSSRSKGKEVPVKEQAKSQARQVMYDKLEAEWHLGDEALTGPEAMTILGWEEEPQGTKWLDEEYLLKDEYGRPVRCHNNAHNREFRRDHALGLTYDLLNRHWADSRNSTDDERVTQNGESIIIGEYGNVLSAQHRLVGLALAHQKWHREPHWKDSGLWPEESGPPTMEALIVRGVSEGSKTTRTLDNVLPRGLNDVLYADARVFGKHTKSERATLTKMIDTAVRTLWDHTGAGEDGWSPYRTHSEALEFIYRHPKVSRFVKHIFDVNKRVKVEKEWGDWPVARYIGPGTAAALAYLMAASLTVDPDGDYWHHDVRLRNESTLNFSALEKSIEFWTALAKGQFDKDMRAAIAHISALSQEVEVTPAHKRAVICKIWPFFRDEEPYELEDILPSVQPNAANKWVITELITVGGIDQGKKQDRDAEVRRQKAGKVNGDDEPEDTDEGTSEEGDEDSTEGEGSPATSTQGGTLLEVEKLPNHCQECRRVEMHLYGEVLDEAGPKHDKAVEVGQCNHPADRLATEAAPDDPTPEDIAAEAEKLRMEREEKKDKRRARKVKRKGNVQD